MVEAIENSPDRKIASGFVKLNYGAFQDGEDFVSYICDLYKGLAQRPQQLEGWPVLWL